MGKVGTVGNISGCWKKERGDILPAKPIEVPGYMSVGKVTNMILRLSKLDKFMSGFLLFPHKRSDESNHLSHPHTHVYLFGKKLYTFTNKHYPPSFG